MWQLFVVQAYICMLLVYWLPSSIKQLTGRNRRFHSSHKKNFEIVLGHVRYSAILPFTVLYIVRRADGKYRPWEPGSSRSEVYWCCERWSAETAHNTRVLGTEDNNDQSAFSHCSWAADYDGGNGRNGGGLKRGVKCHKGYLVGGRERAETLWHRQTLTIENNRATVGTTVVAVERWWVEGVKPTCQLLLENKRTVCTWCISVFSSFTLEGRCVGNREEEGGVLQLINPCWGKTLIVKTITSEHAGEALSHLTISALFTDTVCSRYRPVQAELHLPRG